MSESPKSLSFDREIRIGLVLYGGVSLAVYMNGVCREFYNAVRGRGIYRFLKAFTNADIIVDILSGTSAGGINGVLLSYALTNSQRLDADKKLLDFSRFADIWRNSGSIDELLHKETTKATEISSVLDGKGYYQKALENGIDLTAGPRPNNERPEWTSRFKELDLFVTGTDVDGRVYTVLDTTKSAIEVKSHRVVFLLKHREGRKEPFNPDFGTKSRPANHKGVIKALAKLCRITSCFPVAFPVVEVKIKQTSPSDRTSQSQPTLDAEEFADQKLVLWGELDNRYIPNTDEVKRNGYSIYFLDGGVLDNRPFTYTINEMKYRVIDRPIERKLFFLDPDPDSFIGKQAKVRTESPGLTEVFFDSLSGLPSYESIANDLRLIESYNDNYTRYQSMVDVISSFRHRRDDGEEVASSLASEELSEQRVIYFRSRFLALRDRILPIIFNLEGTLDLGSQYEERRKDIHAYAARLLVAGLDRVSESDLVSIHGDQIQTSGEVQSMHSMEVGNLYSLFESIDSLDIEYFIREHLYCLKIISRSFEVHKENAKRKNYQKLLGAIGRQLKLLEIFKEIVSQTLSKPDVVRYFFEQLKPAILYQEESGEQFDEARLTQTIFQSLLGIHQFLFQPDHLDTLDISLPSIQSTSPNAQSVNESLDQDYLSKLLSHYKKEVIPTAIEHLKAGTLASVTITTTSVDNILTRISAQSLEIIQSSDLGSPVPQSFRATSSRLQVETIAHDLAQEFKAFKVCIDLPLYPLEYLSGMSTGAEIELIRISPDDAKLGYSPEFLKRDSKEQRSKLAGEQLRAFGGFFKRSWRANDILWGRLDGVNRIVDGLVSVEGVEYFRDFIRENSDYLTPEVTVYSFNTSEYWTAAVDRLMELSIASHPDETDTSVPRKPDFGRPLLPETIREWKDNYHTLKTAAIALLDPELDRSPRQLEAAVATLREMLVFFCQFEIVQTDLPSVIEDAILQQIQWSQQRSRQAETQTLRKRSQQVVNLIQGFFKSSMAGKANADSDSAPDESTGENTEHPSTNASVGDTGNSPLPTYQAVGGYFDQLVTPLAAARLASESLTKNDDFDLHQFFKGGQYSVGLETLTEDMPKAVLDDLTIRGVMTVEKLLENTVEGQGVKTREKPFILRIFFGIVRSTISGVRFSLQNPTQTLALFVVLLVVLFLVVVN